MKILKLIRYGAWLLVGVVAFASAAILLGWWQVDGPGGRGQAIVTTQGIPQVGGPFTLIDQAGKTVTDADFRGKPMAVFFGFTQCPDVCPTTLLEMTNWLAKLGPDAGKLQALFISVDPERDTPEQLSLYLQSFDPGIRGLSGSRAQVDAAISAYKAYAKRIPTEGSYTMDHTASVYLMDAEGRFRTMIDYHEDQASALAKIKRLLG